MSEPINGIVFRIPSEELKAHLLQRAEFYEQEEKRIANGPSPHRASLAKNCRASFVNCRWMAYHLCEGVYLLSPQDLVALEIIEQPGVK